MDEGVNDIQREMDAHTLAEAALILSDPTRKGGAQEQAQRIQMERQKQFQAMRLVATADLRQMDDRENESGVSLLSATMEQ